MTAECACTPRVALRLSRGLASGSSGQSLACDHEVGRLGQGYVEPSKQLGFCEGALFGKFCRKVGCIFGTANARSDPLTHIATNMKNQVGDAVHRRRWSPPNLFLVELLQAVFDVTNRLILLIARFFGDGNADVLG